MKVIKDLDQSVLLKNFSVGGKHYLCATTLLCYDLLQGRLDSEQTMWQQLAPLLRKGEPLDMGLPKPRGEFLAYGHCHSATPVAASEAGIRVGPLEKKLSVTGERYYTKNAAGMVTRGEPAPFTKMDTGFRNAYGGPEDARNPLGAGNVGNDAFDAGPVRAPSVMSKSEVSAGFGDKVAPQSFEPVSIGWKGRIDKAGTYDEAWVRSRWPDFPDDLDPAIFNAALPDQILSEGFFKGDEHVLVERMHPEHASIESSLPRKQVKSFFTRVKRDDPYEGNVLEETFVEATNRLDTVLLFTDVAKAVLVYRAIVESGDDESSDIIRGFFVTEPLGAPQRDLDYYRELEAQRTNRSVDIDAGKFDDLKAKLAKSSKKIADMPMRFEQKLKALKGEAPTVHSSPMRTLDRSVQKFAQMQEGFQKIADDGIIEKIVAKAPQHEARIRGSEMAAGIDRKLRDAFGAAAARLKQNDPGAKLRSLDSIPQRMLDEAKKAESKVDTQKIAELDPSSLEKIEGMKLSAKLEQAMLKGDTPAEALLISSWADGAGYFVGDRAEDLKEESDAQGELEKCGLRPAAVESAYIGYNPAPARINSGAWKQDDAFDIPAGFVLPYFDKTELKKLVIRPRLRDENEQFIGDAEDIEVEGSSPCDLVLRDRHGEALLVVSDFIEAWLMYQELWDVCTVACFKDEKTLLGSDYWKASAQGLRLVVTTGFDMAPINGVRGARLPLEKGLVSEAGKRDFRGEVIGMMPEGDRKESLLKEERKKARMGLFYRPEIDAQKLKKEMSDIISGNVNKRKAEAEAQMQEHKAAAIAQNPELKEHFDKFDAKMQQEPTGLKPGEAKQKAKQALEQTKAMIIQSQGPDSPLLAELDKKFAFIDSPEFDRLENLKAEVEEKLAPVKAQKPAVAFPDWAKRQFKKAFGKDMDAEKRVFKSAEEVQAHYDAGGSFAYAGLAGLELDGMQLGGAEMTEADLTGVSLKNADFTGVRLERAKLTGADLTECKLEKATMGKANLMGATIEHTDFRGADMNRVIFNGVEAKAADFGGADLGHAVISSCRFINCKGEEASFANATMNKSSFDGGNYAGASFRKVLFNKGSIKGCDLSGAELAKMTLAASKMEACTAAGADMTKMKFVRKSTLNKVDAGGSDLSRTYFDSAELNDCTFSRGKMGQLYMNRCRVRRSSFASLSAERVRVERTLIEGCDMHGGDYMYGSFRKSFLSSVDLSGSNLFGTDLFRLKVDRLNLDGANLDRTALAEGREKLIGKEEKR